MNNAIRLAIYLSVLALIACTGWIGIALDVAIVGGLLAEDLYVYITGGESLIWGSKK